MKKYLLYLVLVSVLLIFSFTPLLSMNKIQSQRVDFIRFKTDNKISSTNGISERNNSPKIRTMYQTDAQIISKLAFLNSLRNFTKTESGFVDKSGRNLYEDGKIYIRLKNPIILNSTDSETGMKSADKISNPDVDRIALKYNYSKIITAVKLSNSLKSKTISTDAEKYRELLNRTYILYVDNSVDLIELCIELAKSDEVDYAEPIPCNYTNAVPNDTDYGNQHALINLGAPAAWDIYKGENGQTEILIGVCDSGVDWDHPDLRGNLKQNLGEDANGNGQVIIFQGGQWILDPGDINNIDDDFNGYVDDMIGWNFVTFDGSSSNNPMASILNSHGTHVAGICDAVTNNSTGVAGLPWNVKFIPTKHGDNTGGSSIYFGYNGIVYLAEYGADVINCSWGGYLYSETDQTTVNMCYGLGSIIIAAAGNDDISDFHYPSTYQNVVSIASINKNNIKTSYSNFGISIDASTYGGESDVDNGIYSTVPNDGYDYKDGTSMASPYAAAVAAYYKAYKPNSSNFDILKTILGSSVNISNENPLYQDLLGYGSLNVYNAVTQQNPDISHVIEPYFWDFYYYETSGDGIVQNGETMTLILGIRNFNQLYGTNNFNYKITCTDPDITLQNGEGTTSLDADGFLKIDNVHFVVSQNCPYKIVRYSIRFFGDGFDMNFVSSTYIQNKNSTQEAYGYVAYNSVTNIEGPVKFKINNPGDYTLIQDQSSQSFVRAATYLNNQWYGYDASNNLFTIDKTTGARTQIANLGTSLDGLAYDFNSRKMYASKFDGGLYEINLSNNSLNLIYSFSNYTVNLAANKKGNLFTVDLTDESIYSISRYKYAFNYLWSFGYNLNYAQDMEYDYNNDVMYAGLYTFDDQSIFAAVDDELGFYFEIGHFKDEAEMSGLVFPHNWTFAGVILQSPVYNQFDVPLDHTFQWDNFNNADNYKIIFSQAEDFSLDYYEKEVNTNSTQISDNYLKKSRRFFWKVIAYNSGNIIGSSPVWTFNTIVSNYCVPSSDACDEFIQRVQFNTIDNISDCGEYLGFSEYTHINTDIRRGATYAVKILNGNPYPEDQVYIWIDWNQNNNFDVTTEQFILTSEFDGLRFTGDIQVPLDAVLGVTTMRIRMTYNTTPAPCGNESWGETEDYSVTILEVLKQQEINLPFGWSLISSYMIPDDPNMFTVWNNILDKVIIVKNNSGQVFIPSFNINNIGNWLLHQGYYVYMNLPAKLTVTGNFAVPENESVNLTSGWNTISYLRNSELLIITAMKQLTDENSLLIAKNNAGDVYIPSFGINTIGNMKPGVGYKVYVTKNTSFKYPAN